MWKCERYISAVFLFISLIFTVIPMKAHAFSCTNNNGTQTVSVDLTLTDSDAMTLLTDMSTYTTCTGNVGGSENDALRVKSLTTSSALAIQGYTGYFQTPGSTFPDSTTFPVCVWPQESDVNCDPLSSSDRGYSEPLALKIYVKRTGITTSDDLILKAGTEVARISLDQRSLGVWGWTRTWIFVLKNDVPIPAHTCDVDASTPSEVTLSSISSSTLQQSGTSEATDFSVKLKCQGNVSVSILLDGQEDKNATTDGVLANIADSEPASRVGIQILYNNIPVKLRETFSAGVASDGIYDIPMQARYYKTSVSPVRAGNVKSVMTYNLTYK